MRAASFRSLAESVGAVRELMREALRQANARAPQQEVVQSALHLGLDQIELLWGELKQAAEARDAAHRRSARFFRAAPLAFLVTDLHGVVLDANPRAGALLLTPPEALVMRPLRLHLAPETLGTVDYAALADRSGQSAAWRGTLQRRDGFRIGAELSVCRAGTPVLLCWLLREADAG
jgi:PAS domain-containing protein